jgi:hypothetical protein
LKKELKVDENADLVLVGIFVSGIVRVIFVRKFMVLSSILRAAEMIYGRQEELKGKEALLLCLILCFFNA